jgi:hypothetical protein
MADVAAVLEDYDDMDQGEEGDIVLEVSADGEAMEDGELTEPEEAVKVLVCLVLFFLSGTNIFPPRSLFVSVLLH